MRRTAIIFLVLTTLFFTSCGEYEKLLKSTDFDLKKAKAIEYYDNGQYVKATELLSQILPRYRATGEAESLNWINAKAFYALRDYMVAGELFSSYSELFPFSEHAEEATFMIGLCSYQLSPRAQLDQTYTRQAIEQFTFFVQSFPASARVAEANQYISTLNEKLVEKSYINAKMYYDLKQYKSASVALNNSLKDFPQTKFREELMYLRLSSLYLYAENSVSDKQKERYQAALDDYYSYVEEFPSGQFKKEAEKLYDFISTFLGIDKTERN